MNKWLKDHGSITVNHPWLLHWQWSIKRFGSVAMLTLTNQHCPRSQQHQIPVLFLGDFNIAGKMNMWVITKGLWSGEHLYWLDTVMDVFTHRRPLPSTPLATRAEAGRGLRGTGQVGAVWFVGHSSLGISAADITLPLPLATGHRALTGHAGTSRAEINTYPTWNLKNVCIMWFTNCILLLLIQNYHDVECNCLENAPQNWI